MKEPDYDYYKDINKDTQLPPVRPGSVAAYLGIMGQVWMIMYVLMLTIVLCNVSVNVLLGWVPQLCVNMSVLFCLHYKCLVKEETCTQTLQTFYQAKHYKDSPFKSEDLTLANQNLYIIFEPRKPEYMDAELCEIYVSKTHPYLAASPDAIIDDDKLVEF